MLEVEPLVVGFVEPRRISRATQMAPAWAPDSREIRKATYQKAEECIARPGESLRDARSKIQARGGEKSGRFPRPLLHRKKVLHRSNTKVDPF